MFWFLDESVPGMPEFGGFSFGLIDESNPAPRGAVELDEKALEKAIQSAETNFSKAVGDALLIPSKSALNKMKEADVVKLAIDLGIDASVDDKKSDTINKILALA